MSKSAKDIFPKEFRILESNRDFIRDIENKSLQDVVNSHAELTNAYQKLLRLTTKITSLGDSAQSKMERIQEQLQETLELLQIEKQRSQDLLHNILPIQIANRMQSNEHFIADKYESVTVLFADIVGFTNIASDSTASELVSMLNEIFTRFDDHCNSLGVEKIKTIGDSYMAVSGMPETRSDHAVNAIELARKMLGTVNSLDEYKNKKLNIRIGLHSGEVVAGVIGKNKFAYDLWGDTVNLASRMESHGEEGKIHVSKSTFELLKNQYNFESRGEVYIKGKGEMTTYFLQI